MHQAGSHRIAHARDIGWLASRKFTIVPD
jgi:hypothetical protein